MGTHEKKMKLTEWFPNRVYIIPNIMHFQEQNKKNRYKHSFRCHRLKTEPQSISVTPVTCYADSLKINVKMSLDR